MLDPSAIEPALRTVGDPLLARVEEAGLNAAQPREQLLVDGWLLRFSPGKARRSRSISAVLAGTLPLGEKLALCRRWYDRFRLPLLVRVTPFSQPAALDDHLRRAGFEAFDETRVMTRALDGLAAGNDALSVRDADVATFAAAVGQLRGAPVSQIEANRRRLADCPLRGSTARLVAYAGEEPIAAGQVVVQDDLAGLYDIVTATAERGRGFGRAISGRLLAAGAAMGATVAYLQVDVGNAPARRVYSSLGFADRYAYWYRRPADVVEHVPVQEERSR